MTKQDGLTPEQPLRATTRISIITPSYNRADMLIDAIESVLAQDFETVEHLVVDGGSTDGSLQILRQYPHLKIISGPDQGMYDALNRGLQAASGEIIGFLNTDDVYTAGTFSKIAGMFNDPDIMAVAGRAVVFSELPQGTTKIVDQYSPADRSLIECSTIGSNYFNAWFFRRSTFDRIGRFNAGYKITGDKDFMLRFALHDLKYVILDELVYKYRMHEDSLTFDKNGEKRAWSADENLAMARVYLSNRELPAVARKLLTQLRTLETMDMAARSLWMRNPRKVFHYFLEGLRYHPAWPFSFFQYLMNHGMRLMLANYHAKAR